MQDTQQKVHFIAIGGSVMHNLAIALHLKGYQVSGSDDVFFDPSRGRLATYGLLPEPGWDESRITGDLDAVILGMHAKENNPELLKARQMGLRIFSFPEYIYDQSQDKQRVVIAGSHGKTTITSMIMHVLKSAGREFDYVVGASVDGFDISVQLSDAPLIIIEGDEYLSSPLDPTPKFLNYRHHIGVISGISWDHINVFPTMDEYVKQFDLFADASPKAGVIIYNEEDAMATVIGNKDRPDVARVEYKTHKHKIRNGATYLTTEEGEVPVQVFGRHNMQNLAAAKAVCKRLGLTNQAFYAGIRTFKGAARRLEMVGHNGHTAVFKDYAHSPSKLEATTRALKTQYPDRGLVAAIELHTFSSLNSDFLDQYNGTFTDADVAIVYINQETALRKQQKPFSEEELRDAFNREDLLYFTDIGQLEEFLKAQEWENKNLLLMSSGNFGDLDIPALSGELVNR